MSEWTPESHPENETDINGFNKITSEAKSYTVDDAVNKAGYGKFQIRLLILSGIAWIAESVEVFIISVLSQFLACDWTLTKQQPAILAYAAFIGITVGCATLGSLADILGRKKVLAASLITILSFGLATAFVPSFLWMAICRSFVGFGVAGVTQGLTVCTEYCPIHMRGRNGFFFSYFWTFGTIMAVLLSWVIMVYRNSWRLLLAILALPPLLVLLCLNWYPESARYYLVSHQYERAVEVLQKVAKTNGTDLPPGRLVHVFTKEKRGRLKDLLSKEYRVATLLIWYLGWASSLIIYGTVFITPIIIQSGFLGRAKSDNQTSGNQSETDLDIIPCVEFTQENFVDLLWMSSAELPGLLIFTFIAEKWGRKVTLSVSCFINGVLLPLLLLRTYKSVILLILFAIRGFMVAIARLSYIISLEIYPTTFRSVGLAYHLFFSQVAGFVIPYVSQVLVFDYPEAVMGLLAGSIFLAGIAAAFLPFETKGVKMKEIAK
ncbi:Synaptic vesicle 2-related protein, partial [Araneus ventricosus]